MIKKSRSNPRDSQSNANGVNEVAITEVVEGDLASDPRWRLAQRVAQSELFRHSPRLRAFLLFVVERTLRNCAAELSEYEIGTRVFDRTADFNPAEDSIVRSSARLLRGKLKDYFTGEGGQEPLVIEVPKGAYVAEFVPRIPAATAGLDQSRAARPGLGRIVSYIVPVTALLLLAAGILAWRIRPAPASKLATDSATNLIFSIFQPGAELNLVYGDSSRTAVPDLRPPGVILDDYVRTKDREAAAGARLITSYRDAAFGLRLAESASRQGRILIARHSRLMQARDFRAGNFLLLGGVLSNPWSALFEPQLNFRFATDPAAQHRYGFLNAAPRAGEPAFYSFSPDEGRNGVRYARIALTPNLTGTGKVLTLAGQSAEGTEGAGDAALAGDFPAKVQALAGNRPLAELTSFEVLLEVHSMDGAARAVKILAYRVR